jgi:hypothetical protein
MSSFAPFFEDEHGLFGEASGDNNDSDEIEKICAWPSFAEPIGASPTLHEQVQQHDALLQAHDARLRHIEDRVAAVPAPVSVSAVAPQQLSCAVRGCPNRTGLEARTPPRDLVRHMQSRSHVDAALGFLPELLKTTWLACECASPDADSRLPVSVVVADVLSGRSAAVRDVFAAAGVVELTLCRVKSCLRIVLPRDAAAAAAVLDARRRAAELLLASDGGRKRARVSQQPSPPTDHDSRTVQGDQTVAIAFAADQRFDTPGAAYVLLDAVRNQLTVQMVRPPLDRPFHVVHVARQQRWMEHVIHFAPRVHALWQTHVAVADGGFVDAFVLLHPQIGASAASIESAAFRRELHERIACDEWLLCAGRDDGWLELVRRDDLGALPPTLIPLPLSHLMPHTVRLYDAAMRPALPLMSDAVPHAVASFERFAPRPDSSGHVTIEMLCKLHSWLLVAPSAAAPVSVASLEEAVATHRAVGVDAMASLVETIRVESETTQARAAIAANERSAAVLAEVERLRAENAALQLELHVVRNPVPRPLPSAQPYFCAAATSTAEAERELLARRHPFLLYRKNGDARKLRLCMQLPDGAFVHSNIEIGADGTHSCVRQVTAATLEELLFDQLLL